METENENFLLHIYIYDIFVFYNKCSRNLFQKNFNQKTNFNLFNQQKKRLISGTKFIRKKKIQKRLKNIIKTLKQSEKKQKKNKRSRDNIIYLVAIILNQNL